MITTLPLVKKQLCSYVRKYYRPMRRRALQARECVKYSQVCASDEKTKRLILNGEIDFLRYEWQQQGLQGGEIWEQEYVASNKVSREDPHP